MIVQSTISYDYKSLSVFLNSTERKRVTVKNYIEQVLEPAVAPAFLVQLRFNESSGSLYVEDYTPVHEVKLALVEVKKSLGIPLHLRLSFSPDLNPIKNI